MKYIIEVELTDKEKAFLLDWETNPSLEHAKISKADNDTTMRDMSLINIGEAMCHLPEEKREIYKQFMYQRFIQHDKNAYIHINYAMEWVGRFENNPIYVMDKQSLHIYESLLKDEI